MAGFFAGRRLRLAAVWSLGIAAAAMALVTPHQFGSLTNRFAGGAPVTWAPVLWGLLAVLGAQAALSVLGYSRRRLEVALQESLARSFSLGLYGRILRFSAGFFRERTVEEIGVRAIEDSSRTTRFLLDTAVALPLAILSMGIFGAYMVHRNWFLGLCTFLLTLLSGYFILLDRRMQAFVRRERETWEGLRSLARETVQGVDEFRSHATFEFAVDRLARSFDEHRDAALRLGGLTAVFHAATPLVRAVQTGALYWIGAALCIAGSRLTAFAGPLKWGDVIAFLLVAALFQGPVATLVEYGLAWRMARESVRRVREILDRPCVFDARPGAAALPAAPAAVEIRRVSVLSPAGARLLDGIDLDVRPGEHVAIVGPAGCGKSTLLHLLTQKSKIAAGRVLLDGRDLVEYDIRSLGRDIGFVPQKPVLLNAALRENILLGLRRSSERTILDGSGPLDISRFSDVATAEDLDRRLLRTVRLSALEEDVLRKCLDARAPQKGLLRERIAGLRAAVVRKTAPELRVPFGEEEILPGSLFDNLFDPEVALPAERLRAMERAFDVLRDDPLLADLLRIGCFRYGCGQSLGPALTPRVRMLEGLAPPSRMGQEDTLRWVESLSDRMERMQRDSRLFLLEIALDGDLDGVPAGAVSADFRSRLVAARKRLRRNARPAGALPPHYDDGLTLRENLLWGRPDPGAAGAVEEVDRVIRGVLDENRLLDAVLLAGLEFQVGEEGKFLSGGQRQKVAIARAILKEPSILLLDEATASMDEISQSRIVDLLKREFAGKTVLQVSHRLSAIRDFDRIVVLDRGRIVQQGKFDELAAQEGLFRELARREEAQSPRAASQPEMIG